MQITPRNVKKRELRLIERKQKLGGAKCLNCEVLLAETIEPCKRAYKYCRYCIQNGEAAKHRWNRYYQSKRETLLPKMRIRAKLYKPKPKQITESLVLSPERIKYLQMLSLEDEPKITRKVTSTTSWRTLKQMV